MSVTGRPRLLSNADIELARNMRRSGSTLAAIGKRLRVDAQTVSRRLQQPYKQPERRW